MKTLALDLGGSRLKMALLSQHRLLCREMMPVDSRAPLRETLQAVADAAHTLLRAAQETPDTLALALPGIVCQNRVVSCNGKYEEAVAFDWSGWAHGAFGRDIWLINDAAAALYGELHYGTAQDAEAAALLIVGTGIGTAAAQQRQVLTGRHGTMGMLGGHMAIEMLQPRRCTCGSTGCLEAWAGTWALSELARADAGFSSSCLAQSPVIDYRAVDAGRMQGDALCGRLFDTACQALGMGAVNLIHAYDPEVLILSGGPCHIPELCQRVQDYVRRNAWTPWGEVEIRIAQDPEASVLWGLHHYAGLCMDAAHP